MPYCLSSTWHFRVGMDCISFEEGHMQQLEGSAYYIDEELFISKYQDFSYSMMVSRLIVFQKVYILCLEEKVAPPNTYS